MRKVTKDAVDAFVNSYKKTSGNTAVFRDDKFGYEIYKMTLHGNLIAEKVVQTSTLIIRDGGWASNTTKERLNGILDRLAPGYAIVQRDFQWLLVDEYDNKKTWNGWAEFRAGSLITA